MSRLTLAFHSNQLSIRGTEVALFDYADAAESVLGHRSVICYPAQSPANDPRAIAKFQARFELIPYDGRDNLDATLTAHGVDLLYAIKAGRRDGLISRAVPTMVHAVFPTSPFESHGASYAYISEWLSDGCSGGLIPAVPHIVHVPTPEGDLRASLGIPDDALVLGCYGGQDSFDVPAAIAGLRDALDRREDLWFVALHLRPFLDHPRARFLAGTSDMQQKARFIATCDAMLHARLLGESFGLACGEFSVCNRRVIAYARSKHRHHLQVLGDAALTYTDASSLTDLLMHMDRRALREGHWDRYSERYNPTTVMTAFDQHLIRPALARGIAETPGFRLNWTHRIRYWAFKWQMKMG